jgi:hypothetical protein
MTLTEDHPLSTDEPDLARRIREVLARADFTEKRIQELLHVQEYPSYPVRNPLRPVLLRRTESGGPLETLIRLFVLMEPVDLNTARRALAPTTLEDWARLGLLRVQGDVASAEFELRPYQGLVAAFDPPGRPSDLGKHVMGPSGSSQSLAERTVRRPSGRTLDVGTGCGVQAFLAAAHSESVLAVDRNPRALGLAAFNAQLNDIGNVELVEGNLMEPAVGQAFDLIVGNLPYVISPESGQIYRESGMPGHELGRFVTRRAAPLLREGGFCQFLCCWSQSRDGDGRDLAAWFEGSGCDAWVMREYLIEPDAYAVHWIRETEGSVAAAGDEFERWMKYYKSAGIELIGYGMLTLRRASGRPNWFRHDAAPEWSAPCADAIERRFALRDFLEATRDDEALLAAPLRVASEACWEQRLSPAPDGWATRASRLRLTAGLLYSANADGKVVALVGACDGSRPLRQVLADLADRLGVTLDAVVPPSLPIVRKLIEDGFLLPAEPGTVASETN